VERGRLCLSGAGCLLLWRWFEDGRDMFEGLSLFFQLDQSFRIDVDTFCVQLLCWKLVHGCGSEEIIKIITVSMPYIIQCNNHSCWPSS